MFFLSSWWDYIKLVLIHLPVFGKILQWNYLDWELPFREFCFCLFFVAFFFFTNFFNSIGLLRLSISSWLNFVYLWFKELVHFICIGKFMTMRVSFSEPLCCYFSLLGFSDVSGSPTSFLMLSNGAERVLLGWTAWYLWLGRTLSGLRERTELLMLDSCFGWIPLPVGVEITFQVRATWLHEGGLRSLRKKGLSNLDTCGEISLVMTASHLLSLEEERNLSPGREGRPFFWLLFLSGLLIDGPLACL